LWTGRSCRTWRSRPAAVTTTAATTNATDFRPAGVAAAPQFAILWRLGYRGAAFDLQSAFSVNAQIIAAGDRLAVIPYRDLALAALAAECSQDAGMLVHLRDSSNNSR
jgi:hypothetical protein